ncbi:MAG: dihydrolipoyl dehydrogenase [Prevotella sp.]|nr:dihydrolipoyl dehydrogenase [Prevotella sp.]
MTTSDLIIIGAGPGGYRAAEYAAKNGLHVTIFENSHVGGTCLNEGCIPTKSFARNAEIVQTLKEAETFGLNGEGYALDFKKVVERKNQVLENLRAGIETLLSHPNIALVRDRAEFVDAHTVKDSHDETYTAQNIIVATGSVSKLLRLEEWDPEAARDSEFMLRNDALPHSLCIVGAGVIGMEFASIFNSFGVEVTVVEFLKECLPALDSDIAKRLRKVLEKRGVTFYMQSAVKAITREGVTFERKGKRQTIEADEVLLAVGRAPRVSDDFAHAGFEYDNRKGITVDDNMQTTAEGIYAIGDVNGRQMLAHAAEMQGIHAVNCMLGRKDQIRLDIMPAAIFTNPEAGCVGLTEDQCKEQGISYTCHKSFYRANGKALAMNESEGMLKLLADAEGRIIGCHVFGAHAADLAQEASVLMCKDTTLHELSQMVHIHPTLSEILLAAAE